MGVKLYPMSRFPSMRKSFNPHPRMGVKRRPPAGNLGEV